MTLYSTYESRENLGSLSLSMIVRNSPTRICKTVSKLEKKKIKVGPVRSLKYAECDYFTLFLVFVKNGKEMNK